ncbi:HAD ATPase, P-type, family IC [Vittaforma corneae ATCC 50505]|uniref:HAD ATPase, P-type, family IC n=1 Tax=Vittaforma corneae (strain ATCC 50505) TaxID=993615 RepID=L2GP27_VITCO|nr:HAD ATPase, P-type, family IC [Vittaforma corneae ATCC 50505]ELA42384.1 HAD ATPase, P-type, family IC [Vittaforma corneae ATCC 50505]
MNDHKLPIRKLLDKYGILEISRKSYASLNNAVVLNDPSRGNNIIFPKRDYSLMHLAFGTILEPVNMLSLLCAAFLVVVYEFNEEETCHLLVFLSTLCIMAVKTIFEVFEESKINGIYKQRLDSHDCRIVNEDHIVHIDRELIKTGDVLDLKKGDTVGADAILVKSNNVEIERSIGQLGVKNLKRTHTKHKDIFEESDNVVLSSDRIVGGRGKAVVVRIGNDTKIAEIYRNMFYKRKYQSELYSEMTLFFVGSLVFGLLLSMALILIGLTTGITFFNAVDLTVSVLITLIPEGIPSTVKLLLFSAGSKLSEKNIYIRDVASIEKLGLVTRILAEKSALVPSENIACSYVYNGQDLIDVELAFIDKNEDSLSFLQKIGYMTKLISSSKDQHHNRAYYLPLETLGDICCKYFANHTRVATKIKDVRLKDLNGTIVDESDFKSIYVTGSVESVLKVCNKSFVDQNKKKLIFSKKMKTITLHHKMKIEGYDSVALAYRSFGKNEQTFKMKGLTFVCVYFLQEMPESDLPLVSNIFKNAGIKFSIATDTHSENKLNSSRNILGLREKFVRDDQFLKIDEPATGHIIKAEQYMNFDAELKRLFIQRDKFIIYRCNADSKSEVVNDLQQNGEVVCFVGSQMDDSRALSKSDIGVCFQDSSRICKEASSMVFNPQKFDDIIYSLEEGRLFFINLQKSIRYILMHISPQLLPFVLYVVLGTPMPLSPILLIFLNYLVEVIPAVFFSFEDPEFNLLLEPPRQCKNNAWSLGNLAEELGPIQKFKRFIRDMMGVLSNGIMYSTTILSWSIIEAGLISSIGCELAFYSVLYSNNIPFSKMFFSANTYFQYKSPDLRLADGSIIDYEEQLAIVFRGQSTYFLGLMVCQFANMLVCRRDKEYFFQRFFKNFKIVVFTIIGIALSTLIIFAPFFETFLLIKRPNLLSLLFPAGSAVLILAIDTLRKFKKKFTL